MANVTESVVRITGLKERLDNFYSVHVITDGTKLGDIDTTVGLARFKSDTGKDGSCCGARLTDFDNQTQDRVDPRIVLYIDSRWNEPIDWFYGLVSLHPELTFDINWGNANDLIAGSLIAKNGEVITLEYRDEDQLMEEDLWLMGVGWCDVCDTPSVAVLRDEACPTCAKKEAGE